MYPSIFTEYCFISLRIFPIAFHCRGIIHPNLSFFVWSQDGAVRYIHDLFDKGIILLKQRKD